MSWRNPINTLRSWALAPPVIVEDSSEVDLQFSLGSADDDARWARSPKRSQCGAIGARLCANAMNYARPRINELVRPTKSRTKRVLHQRGSGY